jgi:hypothetical protein
VANYTQSGAERADGDQDESGRPGLGLELVTTLCGGGSCPTVYRTNRGTLVVQGYRVTPADAGIELPAGELLVEIPADLLAAAMAADGR